VNDWKEGCVLAVIAVLVFYVLGGLIDNINKVTVDNAVPRFAELAQVQSDQITVVRHSNNNQWWFGDTHDVVFEMIVDGKPMGGRCTSGVFSPMVCRIYSGNGE
jgi:hypothetical protein